MASKYIPKNPDGRPQKPINWKTFENLCNVVCTPEEIASILEIGKATLYDRVSKEYGEDFPTVYKRLTDGKRSSLRRTQFKQAESNCSMAIWLGKQYLGQREPDPISKEPPNDKDNDLEKQLLEAKYQLMQMQAKLDNIQSQTNPKLQ